MPERKLARIDKGKVIRAQFLNDMAEGIDTLNAESVAPPKQVNEPPPPSNDPAISVVELGVFIEQSRTVSEVQIFDQNDENFALIDRIETVTFKNGLGETLTLAFNNS